VKVGSVSYVNPRLFLKALNETIPLCMNNHHANWHYHLNTLRDRIGFMIVAYGSYLWSVARKRHTVFISAPEQLLIGQRIKNASTDLFEQIKSNSRLTRETDRPDRSSSSPHSLRWTTCTWTCTVFPDVARLTASQRWWPDYTRWSPRKTTGPTTTCLWIYCWSPPSVNSRSARTEPGDWLFLS